MTLRKLLSTPAILATTVCIVAGPAHGRFNEGATPVLQATVSVETLTTTDRLIIKYRSSATVARSARSRYAVTVAGNRQGVQLAALRRMHNGSQVMQISRRMNRGELDNLMQSLRSGDSDIEYVEPDRLLQPMYVPNDTLYPQQWALSDVTGGIRAPAAWDRATGNGVTIAVIDTGVRPHADLVARLLPGYDFITNATIGADGSGRDADASDPGDAASAGACGAGSPATSSSWHGTHVSGLAAASGGNGVGVTGVAYAARILPLRALGRCGGYTSDVADAIVWAAGGTVSGLPLNPNPAKVINLSLGGGGACDLTSQNAINAARAKGAAVIVAAGNSNTNASGSSPANCTGVIAVAATGKTGGKASYSNFGTNVTVAAPGGDSGAGLLSTLNAGTTAPGADSYASYMGTSMATPVVSGVAALMLSVNPALTPDQIAAMLKSSARAFPAACTGCGAGIVDANAAVSLAVAALGTTPPAPPPPAPPPAPAPPPPPATTPNPGVTAVKEAEPNNSIATAQKIASLSSVVSGSIGTSVDTDYYQFSVPAGKKVTLTLKAGAASGFGFGLYMADGRQLLLSPGVTGRLQQVTVSNGGSAAVSLVARVLLTTGSNGSYTLTLAP
ncbi:MAG: S8 family peptidase [Rhizobacter sp.]